MKASRNVRVLAALALMVEIFSISVLCELENTDESKTICKAPVEGLMKCVEAVKQPNPRPPTQDCCSAIAPADFPCFCKYKDNPILKIMGIDLDLCFALPRKCGIEGAPSHC